MKIKCLRSNGGGEYCNDLLETFLNDNDILHQISRLHIPKQNNVVKHKHQHILNVIRALLINSCIPTTLWVETLATSIYLINRLPSPNTKNKSPYEILHHQQLDYSLVRTFGCLCFPCLKHQAPHKLTPRSTPSIFLKYPPNSKGYKCYNPHTNKIISSRHEVFYKSNFP